MRQDKFCTKNHGIFLIFLLFFPVLFATQAEGGTLRGRVVGITRNPKPFVRVEISGPQGSITAFTDNDGSFSVELQGGQYRIQVIERNQSMQFTIDVPMNGTKDPVFRLAW